MKKSKKEKAKEAEFNMPLPHPPVSAQFTADGLMVTVIEGKKIYYKILSWKDLYKLGKKGKKVTPPQMVQDMTSKLDDMMVKNAKRDEERQKALEELKRKYSTPVRVARPEPLAPVMPVPQYQTRPETAVPVSPEDPLASMFKTVPPPPHPTEAGN